MHQGYYLASKKMRVIFDVSFLGRGFKFPSGKSGIYRAIENLTEELVKAGSIQAFASGFKVVNYFECIDYLNANRVLQAIPLLPLGVNERLVGFFHESHERAYSVRTASLQWRLINRVLNNRVVNWAMFQNLRSRQTLANAEIYHSPFHPFPALVRNAKHLRKVITVYDLIPLLHPHFFQRNEDLLIREVVDSIDHKTWVTCISEATKNDLCEYLPWLDPARVFVTHLAASELFYQCHDKAAIEKVRTRLGIPDGGYVLSLSTLEPRKNIAQTIKSFARLVKSENIDDLSLVLVGSKGWDFESIFNEIDANSELEGRIIVTGFLPDKDLAPLYSGATMFVYPSFYEGFGLPPLEAMQCGVPVITSNTSSLPEVVGTAGKMVAPHDTAALCHAMFEIYASEELRAEMSKNSLAQAKRFSWHKCAEQTMNVYKAAMDEPLG